MSENIPKNLQTVISEGYTVKIGKYISEGWQIFKQKICLFLGFTVLLFVVSMALEQMVPRISYPAFIVIYGPLSAGLLIAALQIVKKQSTVIGDFFKGFNYFVPLVLADLVALILILLGTILLILPGIYLVISYLLTYPIILDRRMDFWQGMETSRKIVTKEWFSFLGLALILALINLGGLLLLGLGLLVTIPLSYCVIALA
ncbi:MAG: hypothetical protein EBE86_019315 [Hormoscilla sp. GUM202]|nr:hypothetical protein [Hormoscilla sp. GUM202]